MTTGQMIFPFLVFGAGTGLMLAQITNLTLSAVKPEESGEGSGVNNTVKELGSSLGTAVIGSILLASVFGGIVDGVLREAMLEVADREREAIAVELEDALETFTPEEQQAAIAQLPENVQQALGSIVDTAVIEAKQETLLGIMFFVIICLLVSTFLPREMTST